MLFLCLFQTIKISSELFLLQDDKVDVEIKELLGKYNSYA